MEQQFIQFKQNMKKQVLYFEIKFQHNIKTLFGYREGIISTQEIIELSHNNPKEDTTILDMFHLMKLGYAKAIRKPNHKEECCFFNTKDDYDKGNIRVSKLLKTNYEFNQGIEFTPKDGNFVFRRCVPRNFPYVNFETLSELTTN